MNEHSDFIKRNTRVNHPIGQRYGNGSYGVFRFRIDENIRPVWSSFFNRFGEKRLSGHVEVYLSFISGDHIGYDTPLIDDLNEHHGIVIRNQMLYIASNSSSAARSVYKQGQTG